MVKMVMKWAFVIVDPFDRTYNPGKSQMLSYQDDEVPYQKQFKRFAKRIELKGSLGLDISKLSLY
jgi:hypothetical protein